MNALSTSTITERIRQFVVENYLYMRPDAHIEDDEPLLTTGIIDSMGVMELVAFLEEEFAVTIGDGEITEANFGSLRTITEYVCAKGPAPSGEAEPCGTAAASPAGGVGRVTEAASERQPTPVLETPVREVTADPGPPGQGAPAPEGRQRPALPLAVLGILRAQWYRLYYPMRGIRFSAGRHFRAYASLSIRGPGEVRFGDNVGIVDAARVQTHSREARVAIGEHVLVGAVDFRCMREITVGRDCRLARCTVMDTDFHSTHADRWDPRAPVRVAPVHIGDNVWIADSTGLLPGTQIGNNSVVAFGAVCMREFPENVIIMGNPAKVAAPISSSE